MDMSLKRKTQTDDASTLTPAVFHILLALAKSARHGLGIADEVLDATGGTIRLGPGTLYRSLKEMMRDGFVDEVAAPRGDEDPRRKFYRITPSGKKRLRREAERYADVVELARERNVLPQSR